MNRSRLWQLLDTPEPGDRQAAGIGSFLIVLITLNLAAVIIGTVRGIHEHYGAWLDAFETFSVVVFSLEYLARLWACTSQPVYARPVLGRLRYFLSPLALVDLIAVLPYFLGFLAVDMRFLRALRLLRLFRIAKFGRYSETLALFGRVMRHKKEELVITSLLMLILIILSASLMYFAEHDAQPDKFPDIPTTAWWAVVTLTTVGYGDVFPVTGLGKLFASFVAIFGIAMFALPAGILGASFSEEMRRDKRCPHCGEPLE
ncbi:MAG: ion transporter [Gallionellaceae bacterium]|nr:ion transporter [Gallionellaceae bacterium]